MKKILIFCTVLTMGIGANAQNIYDIYSERAAGMPFNALFYMDAPTEAETKVYKANHVKSVTELSGKKEQRVNREFTFDSNGEMESFIAYSKNGKRKTVYNQFAVGAPNNTVYNRRGEELKKNVYQYNSDSLLLEEVHYKKGVQTSKVVNDYTNKKVTESRYYLDGSSQPSKVWKYEYYADGSKKTSKMYKKGKLKSVWNYECKEEGEQARKHQDTVMVCKNESVDADGNRTVTTRRYNEKGLPVKDVFVYSKDNKIIQTNYYNTKDELYYQFISSNDRKKSVYRYFKKNKLYMYEEIYYNDKEQMLESAFYYNDKLTRKTTNEYSADGQLVATKSTNERARFNSETRYTYDEHRLLSASITLDSKGTVSNASKVMYNFH